MYTGSAYLADDSFLLYFYLELIQTFSNLPAAPVDNQFHTFPGRLTEEKPNIVILWGMLLLTKTDTSGKQNVSLYIAIPYQKGVFPRVNYATMFIKTGKSDYNIWEQSDKKMR